MTRGEGDIVGTGQPSPAETLARRPAGPAAVLPARWRGRAGGGARWGLQTLLWTALALLIVAPCACFLLLAVSPRLFDQGSSWFTLNYLRSVASGATARAIINSLWVSVAAAGLGLLVGFPIAWAASRTRLPARRAVLAGMWLVLLLPSWLPATGWQRLVQPDGVMYRMGLDWPWVTHAIMGPFGVVLLLGLRNVPFTYLALSAALAGLGPEFEDAARVHGATRSQALRLVAPMLAPAIMSALAIGFAESISDYGVAATLAYAAHFPLATYQLYLSIGAFPPSFPAAAAIGWLLVASISIPLALQARALRGRSYAVLSARSRPVQRRALRPRTRLGAAAGLALFFLVALGVPGFGALTGSLLGDYGVSLRPSLSNYRAVFHDAGLAGPVERSLVYAVLTASVTVLGGLLAARLLTRTRTRAARVVDALLLAAVALPSVVFAAGYIFAYNLPVLSRLGVNLYQTTPLLLIGYLAASLPTNARVLVGAVSQLQDSLHDAARTHGAGAIGAWLRAVLPVLSRPLLLAWLLTFGGIFLELPISQLLYAPGHPPVSVALTDNLSNYHFGVGTAESVVAVAVALGGVGFALAAYRLLAPRGWQRIGATGG